MAVHTPPTDLESHGDVDPDAHRERTYVSVALILAVLTALEVATYYFPDVLGGEGAPAFVAVLLVLMVVKFAYVAWVFMHLKWDNRLLTTILVSGIVLSLLVYLAVLLMFRYFGGPMDIPGELFGT